MKKPKIQQEIVFEEKPVEPKLNVGEFDEANSHNSFLEALYAFRGGPTTVKVEPAKTITARETPDLKSGPKHSCWICYKLVSSQ